jgi:hypothetical protein
MFQTNRGGGEDGQEKQQDVNTPPVLKPAIRWR